MEAIILIEIGMPTLQTEIPRKTNTKVITKDIDMADKLRKVAVIRITSYQQKMTNLYNKHVRPHLRRVFENTADPAVGKF